MADVTSAACEAIVKCAELTSSTPAKAFWDVKATLTTIGLGLTSLAIGISFYWQYVSQKTSRQQRIDDRIWSMYNDEIYTPFHALLNSFEEEVKPSMLASKLCGADLSNIQQIVGTFSAILSEIEVFCSRADDHACAENGQFQTTFSGLSANIDNCLGRLFKNGGQSEDICRDVAGHYSTLIGQLRQLLSQMRASLEK